MFKKSTVFISKSVRSILERKISEYRDHKGLWLALEFAHNVSMVILLSRYMLCDDDPRTEAFGEKFFASCNGERERIMKAYEETYRIESHVEKDIRNTFKISVTFYRKHEKKPFYTLSAAFGKKGDGGVYTSYGLTVE